ncbi:MAG: sialidase-1 [Verrucomicrobiales bacterium]|jgi:sialidase-1
MTGFLSKQCRQPWAVCSILLFGWIILTNITSAGQPNILFIAVDDLRPELGCYGADHIHSPNIDKLASQGVRFESAYCQQALCGPSRASVLTGLRPDSTGVHGNHRHYRELWPELETLPQFFKNRGYQSIACGKVNHGVFPAGTAPEWDVMCDPQSWSEPAFRPGPRYYYTEEGIAAAQLEFRKKFPERSIEQWDQQLVFGPLTEAPDVADNVLYDGQVAERAMTELDRFGKNRDAPFFLAVGFIKPHTPHIAPKKYWDLYDRDQLVMAAHQQRPALDSLPDPYSNRLHDSQEKRRYTDQPEEGPFSDDNQKENLHAYYACVSYIDAQIGKVLDKLEAENLADNTIVVLWSDHGYHLGEKGLWGKTTNYELDARVPLIVRAPGRGGNGSNSPALVELVDLYPTLVDLAGYELPGHLQGSSFVPVLDVPDRPWKTAVFTQSTRGNLRGYSETDGTRRHTEWVDISEPSWSPGVPTQVWESYDHSTDPDELEIGPMNPIIDVPHRMRVRGEGWHIVKQRLEAYPFQLSREFGNHMVVQRDREFELYGTAEPGTIVKASFHGKEASATADASAQWRLSLGRFAANPDPQSLTIEATTITGKEPVRQICEDILIGDVWLCTGQSNMRWRLNQADGADAAIAEANHENLRLLDYEARLYPDSSHYSLMDLRSLSAGNFYTTNGWTRCSSETAATFSAVAYFFGARLQSDVDVPIGLVHTAVGGVPMESFVPGDLFHRWLTDPAISPWCVERARTNLSAWLKSPDYPTPHHPFEPGFLAAAGARPDNIAGTIWYQGESNATTYGEGSPAMDTGQFKFMSLIGARINSPGWRGYQNELLPFYFVQLPGLNRDWAPFREMQRRVSVEMPNAGMAVTIDLGDPANVHPTNKRPVGERLALQALKKTYGKAIVADGPTLEEVVKNDSGFIVKVGNVGSGLTTLDGKPLRTFEVAGNDRIYHPATAEIDGDTIAVRSQMVSNPEALRYGWADDPPCNLANREGLPASPFQWRAWPDTRNVREPEDSRQIYATSFEGIRLPAPVTSAGLPDRYGWTAPGPGNAEITGHFAKSGQRSLHILGGSNRSVFLNRPVKHGAILTFAAERWTQREPFRFRISAMIADEWHEIYNGDDKIKVGRRFLSKIKAEIPEKTEQLRFDVTSPENSGLLIDDVELRLTDDEDFMVVTGVEMEPVVAPVLIRKRDNPILSFNIAATGVVQPAVLCGLTIDFEGTTDIGDIAAVRVFANDGDARAFSSATELPTLFGDPNWEGTLLTMSSFAELEHGANRFWVSCELKAGANQDNVIAAKLVSVVTDHPGRNEAVLTHQLKPEEPVVHRIGYALRLAGEDDTHTYRIPGVATTNKGTLIAVYDNRYQGGGDLPGDIDVGMSRSTDGGRSWEPMRVIADMGADPNFSYDGIGDPAVLVDKATGTIWVAATWSHGERSWRGSGPGMTPDETGQLMLTKSDDDGLTWSKPINITEQVKDPEWRFVLQGPGAGIAMKDGTLVFAAQFRGADAAPVNGRPSSTIIYSKDHGNSWSIGTGVKIATTEAQVAELPNGTLMINCRDDRGGSRAIYTTADLGNSWVPHPTTRSALPEPVCMASLLHIDHPAHGTLLLFSNPATDEGRFNMTLKVSKDEGMTWPGELHTLYDSRASAGYSCLTQIDDDHVGVVYEGNRELYFLRFIIDELLSN